MVEKIPELVIPVPKDSGTFIPTMESPQAEQSTANIDLQPNNNLLLASTVVDEALVQFGDEEQAQKPLLQQQLSQKLDSELR